MFDLIPFFVILTLCLGSSPVQVFFFYFQLIKYDIWVSHKAAILDLTQSFINTASLKALYVQLTQNFWLLNNLMLLFAIKWCYYLLLSLGSEFNVMIYVYTDCLFTQQWINMVIMIMVCCCFFIYWNLTLGMTHLSWPCSRKTKMGAVVRIVS